MRPRIIWIVFRKEITEALRDRVTLAVVVLLPLLVYPLMILTLAKFAEQLVPEKQREAPRITLWGQPPTALREWLERTNGMAVKEWEHAPDPVRTSLLGGSVTAPARPAPQSKREALKGVLAGEEALITNNPVAMAARDAISAGKVDVVCVMWPGFAKA